MQLNPYLNFNGNCEAAFTFYQQCLGGKIVSIMTYGDSPMSKHLPSEFHGKIIHARLIVDDKVLMGSDSPPERFQKPQGFSVTLGFDEPAEAERVFHALAENGAVEMELQETFWAKRFGALVDQFGIPWMINCERKKQST